MQPGIEDSLDLPVKAVVPENAEKPVRQDLRANEDHRVKLVVQGLMVFVDQEARLDQQENKETKVRLKLPGLLYFYDSEQKK